MPLAEALLPGLMVPRLVADPHALPFERHVVPPQSDVPAGHTHEKLEHTPDVGGAHAVPAGFGTSAGHDTLAPLHDLLVSHEPDAVWHTFVSTLDGHDTLDALHDVVASHTPADVWQMFVRVFDGHARLDPVQ